MNNYKFVSYSWLFTTYQDDVTYIRSSLLPSFKPYLGHISYFSILTLSIFHPLQIFIILYDNRVAARYYTTLDTASLETSEETLVHPLSEASPEIMPSLTSFDSSALWRRDLFPITTPLWSMCWYLVFFHFLVDPSRAL